MVSGRKVIPPKIKRISDEVARAMGHGLLERSDRVEEGSYPVEANPLSGKKKEFKNAIRAEVSRVLDNDPFYAGTRHAVKKVVDRALREMDEAGRPQAPPSAMDKTMHYLTSLLSVLPVNKVVDLWVAKQQVQLSRQGVQFDAEQNPVVNEETLKPDVQEILKQAEQEILKRNHLLEKQRQYIAQLEEANQQIQQGLTAPPEESFEEPSTGFNPTPMSASSARPPKVHFIGEDVGHDKLDDDEVKAKEGKS